jgi:hypothetical protein
MKHFKQISQSSSNSRSVNEKKPAEPDKTQIEAKIRNSAQEDEHFLKNTEKLIKENQFNDEKRENVIFNKNTNTS